MIQSFKPLKRWLQKGLKYRFQKISAEEFVHQERLIIPGFLIYVLTYFMFGKFNSISIFIGLFAMYGMYSALVDGSQKAMISDIVSKDLRGTGYGIYHAVLGVTLLPASLIAGLLYDKVSPGAPFYFGSIMALTASILMIVFAISNNKSDYRKN